jgi:hypothetical protein
MQTFLMKHDRNAEAALLDEEFLNRVRERCLTAGVFSASRVARTTNLSKTVSVRECAFRFVQVEIATRVDERFGLLLPHAHHLRRFLLERHSREQILDATFRGKVGRLVGQHAIAITGCWLVAARVSS